MKEKLIKLVGNRLDDLNVFIDDVYEEKKGNIKTLYIVLDSDEIIDLDKVTLATDILNPIVDENILTDDIDDEKNEAILLSPKIRPER